MARGYRPLSASAVRREHPLILVTVGSFQFSELIARVDALVANGTIREPVVAQIGSGEYVPRHMEHFRYDPNIGAWYDKARLVICHGGPATMSELMRRKRPFVAIANPSLAHDHQSDTLAAMSRRGWCVWCRSLDDLPQAIERARVPEVPDTHARLSRSIADFFRSQMLPRRERA